MNRAANPFLILGFATLAVFALWISNPRPNRERLEHLRALESRLVKVEEDFRLAARLRDMYHGKVKQIEQDKAALANQIDDLVRERDDMKREALARTQERDAMQSQYDGFRKNLRDLIYQADAALPTNRPATASLK